MSDKQVYSEFIRQLPQADTPLAGVDVRLIGGPSAQAAFFYLPAGAKVPPHSHCAQWGIVVEGELELTIGQATHLFHKGDRYQIADGEVHSALVLKDSWVIDVFDDPARYAAK